MRASASASVQPLPDISGWTYAGTARVRNVDAHMWRWSEKHAEKVMTYVFFTAASTGWPLKLQMMGVNLLSGQRGSAGACPASSAATGRPALPSPADDPAGHQHAKRAAACYRLAAQGPF